MWPAFSYRVIVMRVLYAARLEGAIKNTDQVQLGNNEGPQRTAYNGGCDRCY